MSRRVLKIHPLDNVGVALEALPPGTSVATPDGPVTLRSEIPGGHKFALRDLAPDQPVRKYGYPIGLATQNIQTGDWVHGHNLRTALGESLSYQYQPIPSYPGRGGPQPTFLGYRRATGGVGTRNEIWILPTVGCVNKTAEIIAQKASQTLALGAADGIHAFTHPYGCSQLGDDLQHTRQILTGLLRHPNAGGVLVLGLGCENNQLDQLLAQAGPVDPRRLRWFNTQTVGDEVVNGVTAVQELLAQMAGDRRVPCPASDLVLGMKCGGSDAFSGLTANPLLGQLSDQITGWRGRVLLTEVPEMFGAEQCLMNRAADAMVFEQIVALVKTFKAYFVRHGQPIHENPSPGNKAGGLTTLEEKSLGAIQKGGQATITDVLAYGQSVEKPGLSLVNAPGNDGVSGTALTASGATLILFTTGRGTPLGFPVPTLKISSHTALWQSKPGWLDFDAGQLLAAETDPATLVQALLEQVLATASGQRRTRNEEHGYREIAIWKEGVTL
jgi:altronate hydrolase